MHLDYKVVLRNKDKLKPLDKPSYRTDCDALHGDLTQIKCILKTCLANLNCLIYIQITMLQLFHEDALDVRCGIKH